MNPMNRSTVLPLAAALALAALIAPGCSDASYRNAMSYGSPHAVTLYGAGGAVIRTWTNTGKVLTEEHSDGWFFEDAQTHRLIRVSGTVVIEEIRK